MKQLLERIELVTPDVTQDIHGYVADGRIVRAQKGYDPRHGSRAADLAKGVVHSFLHPDVLTLQMAHKMGDGCLQAQFSCRVGRLADLLGVVALQDL